MQKPKSEVVALWTKNFFIGLGVIAALITVLTMRDLVRELKESRLSSECRFDISGKINEIGDQINITTARVVVAAIRNNDARVDQLGDILEAQIDDYVEAAEVRTDAVEICNKRSR